MYKCCPTLEIEQDIKAKVREGNEISDSHINC